MPAAAIEFVIIALVFGLNGLWVAALLSAATYDHGVWKQAGRDKQTWILLLIFGSGVAATIYLLTARRDLRRAALES
jgi:hypothetical protein